MSTCGGAQTGKQSCFALPYALFTTTGRFFFVWPFGFSQRFAQTKRKNPIKNTTFFIIAYCA